MLDGFFVLVLFCALFPRTLPRGVEGSVGEGQPVIDLTVFELFCFYGDALEPVLRAAAVEVRVRWKLEDLHVHLPFYEVSHD